jgi:hypothetical protein
MTVSIKTSGAFQNIELVDGELRYRPMENIGTFHMSATRRARASIADLFVNRQFELAVRPVSFREWQSPKNVEAMIITTTEFADKIPSDETWLIRPTCPMHTDNPGVVAWMVVDNSTKDLIEHPIFLIRKDVDNIQGLVDHLFEDQIRAARAEREADEANRKAPNKNLMFEKA